jgi:hypothetical protein
LIQGFFLVALPPGDFLGGSILGEQMAKPVQLQAGFMFLMESDHLLGQNISSGAGITPYFDDME